MEAVARAYAEQAGYEFHERVGEGAFKETYRVSDSNGSIALKILGPNCPTARTEREIDALTRCSHPNIARLRSVVDFEFDGTVYRCLLEDFLAGGTLGSRTSGGPYSVDQAKRLGRGLLLGIQHLHALELVHRDIKPENVMYGSLVDENPVIVDFGIVRDLSASSLTQSWFAQGPGTPLFAAPEQLNNHKELIDWRTDQFSIAVTVSFSVFGFHPYSYPGDVGWECIDRVAGHQAMSPTFRAAAQAVGLALLEDMVKPYPVQRVRTPGRLLEMWEGQ